MKKQLILFALTMAFAFVFMTGCEKDNKVDYVDDSINHIDFQDKSIYGAYTYPDNPAKALKDFMEQDVEERNLPLKIGEITELTWGAQDRQEFTLHFTNDGHNMCVISFNVTYAEYGPVLSGIGNPSFTVAFEDPYNSEDMITVLTSVIQYLSPGLDIEEAERLATAQDETISIDGYSIPQDIGGYQVQAHYTNPYDYFSTTDLSSSLAVTVKALEQIWGGTVNTNQCQELLSSADYGVLNNPSSLLKEDRITSRVVYADFIVTDWWDYESWIHGELSKFIVVESNFGQKYTLTLDLWETAYEFGIGEKYRIFIYYHYGKTMIGHAIQLYDETRS